MFSGYPCTAVVHFIKRVQQISLINLSFNNIGSLGCVEIVKLFDNTNCHLRGLNLGYNNLRDKHVKQLSNVVVNSQLSSLNLMYNHITDQGVKQLSNVIVNSQLSSLNLRGNYITDQGVKQLSNVLVNSQLSSLNLMGNKITDQGVKQLSNVIVNNNKLRRLYLSYNDEITNEAMEQIRQANPNCRVIFEIV